MESEFNKFVKNPKKINVINGALDFIWTPIIKITKIALGYTLNYLNYFILSGLFLIYFGIFAGGINDLNSELFYSIFKFLSIFYPINLTYGAETSINVLIQILFSISLIITLLLMIIKFIIKKIFKVSVNISFAKELLIKFIINTIIWLTLLIISLYVNMGNRVFAFYIITNVLIIFSMIFGYLSKVILKSAIKPIKAGIT